MMGAMSKNDDNNYKIWWQQWQKYDNKHNNKIWWQRWQKDDKKMTTMAKMMTTITKYDDNDENKYSNKIWRQQWQKWWQR